jgi:hypothetical protein
MIELRATGLTKSKSAATSSGDGSTGSAAGRGVANTDAKKIIPSDAETNLLMNLIVSLPYRLTSISIISREYPPFQLLYFEPFPQGDRRARERRD